MSKPHWQRLNNVSPFILLIGLFIFFVWNTWTGIDFGDHWDEPLTLESVTKTIETGILLPKYYNYGGVNFWLALMPIIPEAFKEIDRDDPWTPVYVHEFHGSDSAKVCEAKRSKFDIAQGKISKHVISENYRIDVRRLWAFVAGLGIIWVFGAGAVMTGSRWCGLAASAVYGLSWELVYHSRWIAPDAIATAFVALTLAFTAKMIQDRSSRSWLVFALIAAGIACGTKYNAGIVLLPVLLASWFAVREEIRSARLLQMIRDFTVFALAFLITSPGTVLNPLRFIDARQFNQIQYATGHGGYTVGAGWDHFVRLMDYLGLVVSSWYAIISLGVFVLALFGIYTVIRKDYKAGLVWLSAPVLYVLIIISFQVFFPRNYLLLIPFIALFASYGIWKLWMNFRYARLLRILLVCLLAGAFAANGNWLIRTTLTIPDRITRRSELPELGETYVRQHPEKMFYLSPRVGKSIVQNRLPNLTDDVNRSDFVLFYALEIPRRDHRLAAASNQLTVTWFGPWEVNFNYYPSWIGEDRIIVMTAEKFRYLNLHNYGWIDPATARDEWKKKSGRDQSMH